MFKINKLDLLISVYIFCVVVSEVMGAKTFPLLSLGNFHLNATVAIFVLPFIFTINDIITEVFGKERARSIIRSSLVVIILIFIFSILATTLPPSKRFLATEPAYDQIFSLSTRFSFASIVAFAFAEFLDVLVFSKLREKLGKKNLWLRNNLSNFVSEFIDTMVFMFLAFYALNMGIGANVSFILGIAIPYYLLRCAVSVLETPFVYLGVRWLKSEKK